VTNADDFDPMDAPLPGLGGNDSRTSGEVERAASQTIADLAPQLEARHAVMCQALLTCARQLDRAATSSQAKDYGVANLVAQLRETYLVLVDGKEGGAGDVWSELLAEIRGGEPTVGNPTQP
jgi:hypothetical protein